MDQDFLVQVIPITADDSVPPKNYFKDSADETIVCYEPLGIPGLTISGLRTCHGDAWPDTWGDPDWVKAALEMDVFVFAARWAR